jgi:WD40 repeat protein
VAHPPVDELLRDEPAVRDHLASCPTCRALVAVAEAEPRPGERFPTELVERGRYLEWQVLGGGGGMGQTFRARDRRLGRDVVIKQPLKAEPGLDLRARFEREALLTARLQHPSIVGVYEAGRFDDGEPFFAMPLVRGAPLFDEIARRSTLEERIALLGNVTAVCEAVAYAHEQGIVHRDIKPANILVGSFGETVLIDWGLATDVRDATADGTSVVGAPAVGDGLTQLGVGTVQYMPPEQALGSAPDPRMDVYALGATLYHTLAGVPPYGSAASGEARKQLLAQAPRPLAEIAPQVPPALCDIITRAMARDPGERFATANALAAELRRYQTGQLVESRRYGPGEILRHFARKHRAPLIVAAIAAVVLAAAAITSAVRIARSTRAASAAQQRAEDNERLSQQELRRGLGVSASRLAPIPTRRLDALALAVDAVAPDLAAGRAPVPEALQGLYDAIGAGAPAVVLDANTTAVRGFAFSSDGALLATVSPGEHAVHLWDGRTGRPLGTAAAGGAHFSVRDLRFSPDGRWLLTWGTEPPQAQLWPVAHGRPITLSLDGSIAGAEFLADEEIAIAGNALRLFGRDGVERGEHALPAPAATLAVAAGRIAVGTIAGDVIVWNASGDVLASLRVPSVSTLALSQDGERLALLGSKLVEVRTVSSQAPVVARVALAEGTGDQMTVAFAGRSLVVSDRVRATSIVIDVSRDTGVPRATALGSWLGTGEPWIGRPGRLEYLDLEALTPVRATDGPPGLAVEALASAPGRRIAVATERATWLVDARAGERGSLPGHTSEVTALAVADGSVVSAGLDGRLIAWDPQYRRTASTAIGSEVVDMVALSRAVVVGTADGSVDAFALDAGGLAPRMPLVPPGAPISALGVAPDRRLVLAARADGELIALPFDADRPGTAAQWQHAGAQVATSVVFSADGAWAATGHLDGSIRLWRLSPGTAAASVAATTVVPDRENAGRARFTLAFDASGRLLASRFGLDTAVFALPTLDRRGALPGKLLALTRDGTRAVVQSRDRELSILDLAHTSADTRIASSKHAILAATFSPDGGELLLGDVDGTVRMIDVASAHPAGTDAIVEIPATDAGGVTALAFSPDGDAVIAGHANGTLRAYPLGPQAAVARACRTLADFGRDVASCATRN